MSSDEDEDVTFENDGDALCQHIGSVEKGHYTPCDGMPWTFSAIAHIFPWEKSANGLKWEHTSTNLHITAKQLMDAMDLKSTALINPHSLKIEVHNPFTNLAVCITNGRHPDRVTLPPKPLLERTHNNVVALKGKHEGQRIKCDFVAYAHKDTIYEAVFHRPEAAEAIRLRGATTHIDQNSRWRDAGVTKVRRKVKVDVTEAFSYAVPHTVSITLPDGKTVCKRNSLGVALMDQYRAQMNKKKKGVPTEDPVRIRTVNQNAQKHTMLTCSEQRYKTTIEYLKALEELPSHGLGSGIHVAFYRIGPDIEPSYSSLGQGKRTPDERYITVTISIIPKTPVENHIEEYANHEEMYGPLPSKLAEEDAGICEGEDCADEAEEEEEEPKEKDDGEYEAYEDEGVESGSESD